MASNETESRSNVRVPTKDLGKEERPTRQETVWPLIALLMCCATSGIACSKMLARGSIVHEFPKPSEAGFPMEMTIKKVESVLLANGFTKTNEKMSNRWAHDDWAYAMVDILRGKDSLTIRFESNPYESVRKVRRVFNRVRERLEEDFGKDLTIHRFK